MRQRCRDYVKWCGENGLVPRFEWAVNSDNYKAWCKKKGYQPNQEIVDMMDAHTTDGVYDEYYKVITDFTAYKPIFDKDGNTIGEEPAPHRPVTGDFAMDDKTLGMVLGVDSEGRKVDDNSMLANRENTIKNADANKKEIAEKALLILNGKAKVEDLVRKGGEQFDNNSDSDKFFESSNEGIDRSVRESRSEKTELTAEERELRDNLVERMRKGGLDVVTDSEEMQRVIDRLNERTRMMGAKQKRALETATIAAEATNNATVISSADGAKIQNNLGTLATNYEKIANKTRGFITDLSHALGLKQHESSQYGTFETPDGKRITIRVSNHNARVSNFDKNNESEGISIVISSHKNKGLHNDGNAHIIEYSYTKRALETQKASLWQR